MAKRRKKRRRKVPRAKIEAVYRLDDSIDEGTKELRSKVEFDKNGKVINHPLDWYLKRGDISRKQWRAGDRLYKDYSLSHQNKDSTQLGEERGFIPNEVINPHTCFERYMRALKTLNHVGQLLAKLIIIDGFTLKEVHGPMRWGSRNTGVDRLKEMLDDLAQFYEVEFEAQRQYQEKQIDTSGSAC